MSFSVLFNCFRFKCNAFFVCHAFFKLSSPQYSPRSSDGRVQMGILLKRLYDSTGLYMRDSSINPERNPNVILETELQSVPKTGPLIYIFSRVLTCVFAFFEYFSGPAKNYKFYDSLRHCFQVFFRPSGKEKG